MEATPKNCRIAEEIISLLAKQNCTVANAKEILNFVGQRISNTATVLFSEVKYSD